MSKHRLDTVFVIFDTQNKQLWASKGNTKIGWVSAGAAKNAWANSYGNKYDEEGNRSSVKFDDQTRYTLVPIHESVIQSMAEEK